ncbi:MAG: ATP-binding protein [Synergistaceae bacterium]
MKTALELLKELHKNFYIERNAKKVLQLLAEDFAGYSSATKRIAKNKQEAKTIIEQKICLLPPIKEIKITEESNRTLSPNASIGTIAYTTTSRKGRERTFLLTGAAKEENGETKLTMTHLSERNTLAQMSQGKINEIVNDLPCGIGVYRVENGEITRIYATDAYKEIVGKCNEKPTFSQEYLQDSIHEADIDDFLKILKETQNSETPNSFTIRVKTKENEYKWVDGTLRQVGKNNDVSIIYVIVSHTSNTGQLHRNTSDDTDIGIVVIDSKTKEIYYSNKAAQKMLGKKEKYSGQKCYQYFFSRQTPCEICEKFKEGEKGTKGQIVELKKDLWVHIKKNKSFLGKNEVDTIYLTNMTEQINLSKQIKEILENINCGLVVSKFDKNDQLKIEYINDARIEMAGATKEKAYENLTKDAYYYIYNEEEKIKINNVLKSKKDQYLSFTALTENGEKCQYLDKVKFVKNSDGTTSVYETIFDVTNLYEEQEKNKILRQEAQIAIDHAGLKFWEYDIKSKTVEVYQTTPDDPVPVQLHNFPEDFYTDGYLYSEDVELYKKMIEKLHKGETRAETSVRVKTHTGYVWKKVKYTAVRDEKGNIIKAIGTSENIQSYKDMERRFITLMVQNEIEAWIYNYDTGKLSFTNAKMGLKREEIPLTIDELLKEAAETNFIHKDDFAKVIDICEKIKKKEKEATSTIRMFDDKTKKYRWQKISFTQINSRNVGLYVFGSTIDIDDIVKEKEKYAEGIRQRYKTKDEDIVMQGHSSITKDEIIEIYDKDGNEIYNKQKGRFENYTDTLTKLIEDKTELEKCLKTISKEQLLNDFAIGITFHKCDFSMKKDKISRFYELTIETVKKIDTKEIYGFFTLRDVTEKKMAEYALKAIGNLEYDYVAYLSLNDDTITIYGGKRVKVASGTHGKPQSYNKRLMKNLETVPKSEREKYQKNMSLTTLKHILATKETYDYIYNEHYDGEKRIKRVKFSIFDKEKGLVLATRSDITKIIEEQNRQKEILKTALKTAQEANQAKTDFLSTMSHDIRTPINAIMGMCHIAKANEENKEQIHESLDVIEQSSKLLLGLVNKVLDMNRIESGKMAPEKSYYSIKDHISTIISTFKVLAEEKKQTIESKIDIINDHCYEDKAKMESVISNLLSNAIKYTPEGGTIKYSLKENATQTSDGISTYELTISDTGIGINPEEKETIFEPFYRAKDTQTRNEQGTGLGLAIVKGIVEHKGGTITVKSEKGKGTTFTLKIPVQVTKEKEKPEQHPKEETKTDLTGLKVLICEDNNINQIVAKKLLEIKGATVKMANDGQEGYDIFRQSDNNEFNIIITDIRMPKINGYEMAEKIRKSDHPQAQTIPIIAMSANAFLSDKEKGKEVGMNTYITKPIDPKNLYQICQGYKNTK